MLSYKVLQGAAMLKIIDERSGNYTLRLSQSNSIKNLPKMATNDRANISSQADYR